MSYFELTSKGNWNDTVSYLNKLKGHAGSSDIFSDLDKWGQMGVDALSSATPEDTGLTAESWEYRIIGDAWGPGLEWVNTNVDDQGTPVAILIQYGHGTGTGGYVQGLDYINPAIRPIFDMIAEEIGKKVR